MSKATCEVEPPMLFDPPDVINCPHLCGGQLFFDGSNTTKAFLLCNTCKCCFQADNPTGVPVPASWQVPHGG